MELIGRSLGQLLSDNNQDDHMWQKWRISQMTTAKMTTRDKSDKLPEWQKWSMAKMTKVIIGQDYNTWQKW